MNERINELVNDVEINEADLSQVAGGNAIPVCRPIPPSPTKPQPYTPENPYPVPTRPYPAPMRPRPITPQPGPYISGQPVIID